MEELVLALASVWRVVAGVLTVLLAVIASGHVVLYKRDSRAAVGWVGLIWLAPVVGSVLYILLGVNRIRRKAAEQRALPRFDVATAEFELPPRLRGDVELPERLGQFATLARLVDRVAGRPLTPGNRVTPLPNGDAAFPAMLAAIEQAQTSVALGTYIFDNDPAGRLFADALERAVRRGVQVRVLIDAVGARYSWPPIVRALRRRGIRVARFGQTALPWRMQYSNLRSHRKILVLDGRVGFTGGMNIRQGCLVDQHPRNPVQDLHFQVEGPVVTHLMETFAEDWSFTTREMLAGPSWFPSLEEVASVVARGINDGPDADFEKARMVFLGALACAQRSVRIVTPYFLPDSALITALNVTAIRGVRVDIILPEKGNLALVQWASTAQLWQNLENGCRIYYSPPPFDHSKVMLVDDGWVFVGSSNWDARSLRLNFEFQVECYDTELAAQLREIVEAKRMAARRITADELDGRSLPVRLRDGVARLAAPYL